MSYCISNKTFCCITGHCVVVAAAYHTHRDMNVTITSDRYCVILPLVSAFLPSLEESALLASSLLINRRTAVDAILNHNNNTNGNITFNTIPDNVRDRLSFDDIISILKCIGINKIQRLDLKYPYNDMMNLVMVDVRECLKQHNLIACNQDDCGGRILHRKIQTCIGPTRGSRFGCNSIGCSDCIGYSTCAVCRSGACKLCPEKIEENDGEDDLFYSPGNHFNYYRLWILQCAECQDNRCASCLFWWHSGQYGGDGDASIWFPPIDDFDYGGCNGCRDRWETYCSNNALNGM